MTGTNGPGGASQDGPFSFKSTRVGLGASMAL